MHPCISLILCSLLLVSLTSAQPRNAETQEQLMQAHFGGRPSYYEPYMRLSSSMYPRNLDKRDASYGWHECEFSPLSCLLRRRRRSVV